MTNPVGRPTEYTNELADKIVELMCNGMSVNQICKRADMPARSTVMLWAATDRSGFSDKYAKACEARAHFWADELLDIADDGTNDWMEYNDQDGKCIGYKLNGEAVSRSKLRVDSRKWLLSKMLPRYADRQQVDHISTDSSMTPKAGLDISKLSPETIAELMAAKPDDSN